MFADDLHSGEIFRSAFELNRALKRIGILLDLLDSMQLSISLEKSHVLIACGGSAGIPVHLAPL